MTVIVMMTGMKGGTTGKSKSTTVITIAMTIEPARARRITVLQYGE